MIAAIEHYTRIIGKWILESRGLDDAGADPVMLDLFTLARCRGSRTPFRCNNELFVSVGGGYLQRQVLMLLVGPVLLALWLLGTRYFLGQCTDRT